MRIMHIIASLTSGGVEHLLAKSLAVFDRQKHHHEVCCVSAGGVYQGEIEALGIPVHIMKRRFRFDPTVINQLAKKMEGFDVAHCYNFTGNLWGRLAAKWATVPRIIAHERGTAWTENILMRWVDRRLSPITTVWLANSKAAKTILIQHVGIPSNKIQVIYNGVSVPSGHTPSQSLHTQLQLDPEAPLIGIIGRLDTPKGHHALITAMPYIWEQIPNVHLAIIGTGPLASYLQKLAEQTNHIHFLGYQPDASQLIAELDILIQPSIRESFGNVLVEAGQAKTAVIAANVDGCAEVIINGKTGCLLTATEPVTFINAAGVSPLPKVVVDGATGRLRPPFSLEPQLIAGQVIDLLNHPEKRQRLEEAAQKYVTKQFSLQQFVSNLEKVYEG